MQKQGIIQKSFNSQAALIILLKKERLVARSVMGLRRDHASR